jgi:protein-disulfide isomerase
MEGELDKADLKGCDSREEEIDQILAEYRQWGEKMGVAGTPMIWVNKRQVQGADIQKLESYLASGPAGTR